MRSPVLAATLLAGLLAVAAPTAQALCAVDEEGGCSRLQHFVHLEVSEDCPAEALLCLVDRDGNFSSGPNDADWDVTVRNPTGSAITLELFAFGRYDDDGMPVRDERVAPRLLGTIEVPAGGSATLDDVQVPADVAYLRAQALTPDGRQAETEAELANFRIMMMQPGDDPLGGGSGQEPAGDGDAAPESKKDAPALPLVLLALGVVGALLVARRVR
jgi:hypothetical protein